MRNEGIVIAVDAASGDAVVQLGPRAAACGACPRREGCAPGADALMLQDTGDALQVRLPNPIGVRLGEQVAVVAEDGTVLRASWLAYLLPGLAGIGGAVAGQAAAGDAGAVAGTLCGLAAGFVYLAWRSRGIGTASRVLRLERSAATPGCTT